MMIFSITSSGAGWGICLLEKFVYQRGDMAAAYIAPDGKYLTIESWGIALRWVTMRFSFNLIDVLLGVADTDYVVHVGEPQTVTTGLGTALVVESRRGHKRPRWFAQLHPEVYWTLLEIPDDLVDVPARYSSLRTVRCDSANEALEKLYRVCKLVKGIEAMAKDAYDKTTKV